MSEVRAQITYSPEGVLSVQAEDNLERAEKMSEQPGIEAIESEGILKLQINVAERFKGMFKDGGDRKVEEFINDLSGVLPFYPQDDLDRVVNLVSFHRSGATAVVNHHLQRWLDLPGLTEEVALACMLAMAEPFGASELKKTIKSFSYKQSGSAPFAQAWNSYVIIREGKFGLTRLEETEETHAWTRGSVEWRYIELSTLGDCTCWSVNGEDRDRLDINPSTRQLYEMNPHNVDWARQSLSLVLGLGTLAYAAEQYEGTEDIFAEAKWHEPRVYPDNA